MATGEYLGQLYGEKKAAAKEPVKKAHRQEAIEEDENEKILAEIRALPQDTKKLDLSNTNLTSLSGVELPAGLQKLDLSFSQLTSLSGVELPAGLQELDLSFSQLTSLSGVELPVGLQKLDLGFTQLTSLSGVELPVGLQVLNLGDIPLMGLKGMNLPADLKRLDWSFTNLVSLQGVKLPDGLQFLSLINTDLESLEGVELPSDLKELYLTNTRLTSLANVELPSSLQVFSVTNTNLSSLEDVKLPAGLQTLWIDGTNIRKVPDSIRQMRNLKNLDLSHMTLENLPDWLLEFGLPFSRSIRGDGICLYESSIKGVDMSIFDQSQEKILQWFKERKNQGESPLNEIKVVFLGNGDVGKTHTIARLLRDGEEPDASFTGESTPGIAISDKTYSVDGQDIRVHFWDFGGQEILYSMHRMFLTDRTIYVVMVDARNESRSGQAREWLDTVKSFAGAAPVLLAVNKLDQNPGATLDERELTREYPNLKKIIYLSALKATPEEFDSIFTDALLEQIRESDVPRMEWPRNWKKVKDALQLMEQPYIFSRDYRRICRDCDVDKGAESLLNWCNDLGVCFRREDKRLKDYVILRPEWITNAVYTIVFNKRDAVRNGMISLEDMFDLLTSEESRRVLRDVPYSWQDMTYILDVVRKFSLSYPVDDQQEFFPMLCSENSSPVAQEYADAPDALEFHMEFDYLPNNVLHRLMVERHRELDPDHVWLTGARFRQRDTGLSAVVKIDDDTLKLYVRSGNALHGSNTYLSILAGSVDRICRMLNLERRKQWLIYREGDRTAAFDYEDLLFALEMGETDVLCKELRKKIPLAELLKRSGHSEDKAQAKLLADLVSCCEMLQDDNTSWDKSEDDRTTYIRNLLRSRRYIVQDQSRGGVSAGGERAGELDLDIRREPEVRWTLLEALNLSGSSESRLRYWDAHLDKLLDNYNSTGCPFLFHVTYLSCAKDQFMKHCIAFEDHIRSYSPPKFSVISERVGHPLERLGLRHGQFLRVMECVYDCGGIPMTVYHLFVRIGK